MYIPKCINIDNKYLWTFWVPLFWTLYHFLAFSLLHAIGHCMTIWWHCLYTSCPSAHSNFAKTIPRPFTLRYNPYSQCVEELNSVEAMEKYAKDIQYNMGVLHDALKRKSWHSLYMQISGPSSEFSLPINIINFGYFSINSFGYYWARTGSNVILYPNKPEYYYKDDCWFWMKSKLLAVATTTVARCSYANTLGRSSHN